MKLFQKTLSVLLALVLICSVFTVIPAVAADDTANDDAAEQNVLMREKSVDLSEVGADTDLAGTGHYNIAVGDKVVTENNYNNILGDSSSPHKAVYDPQKKILTLNDPTITKVYNNDPEYGAITIQQSGVTVKGSFRMSSSLSNYGLYISEDNDVTLDGNFTFCGAKEGIIAGGKLTLSGGTVTAKSTDSDGYGIYCDDMVVNNSITKLTAEGGDCAFIGDHLTMNGTRITSPVDAFYSEDARSICLADLSDIAKSAVIEPFSGTYYDLWLGSRHVSSENCRDIYGDGKASYDPQSKTLTLNDPQIVGVYCELDNMSMNYKIYAGSNLNLKGSYHIKQSDLDFYKPEPGSGETDEENDLYNGLRVKGNLTLDGDFTFLAKGNPVVAEGNITIQSGTIKAVGDLTIGIMTLDGNIIIEKDIASLDVTAPMYPLWAKEISIASGLKLVEPAGGGLGVETSSNHQFIVNSEGEKVTHVVIEPMTEPPLVNYNIVVGGTLVTSRNKTDILGDGKARYNPDTNTLTLDDPTLSGVFTNNNTTFSIVSLVEGLTVAGSCHLTSADAMYGFYSTYDATFDGNFTFRGTSYAVNTQNGLTIRSGSLKAISSGNYAIYNKEGAIDINSGVTKVEASGASYAIVSQTLSLGQDMEITSPAGAVLYTITSQDLQTIVTDSAIAKSAVIEYKPQSPSEPPTPTQAPTQAPTDPAPTQAPTTPSPTQAPQPPTEVPLEGSGTQSAPYLIATVGDWNALKDFVAAGGDTAGVYFKLLSDITVSTMIGTSEHPFKGSFDGGEHTLTLKYGSADNPYPEGSAAPFSNVYGCTVTNLHVTGTIYTSSWFAGSIAGWQDGNVTIENCQSNAVIVLSKNGDGSSGGFVGRNDGGVLTINNCVYNGKLLTTSNTTHCGGIVGSRKNSGGSGKIKVINSIYDPAPIGENETEVFTTNGATISRGTASAVTVTNCYYTRTLGTVQGKQAYTVTGNYAALTLNGTPGLNYNGTIYAGKDDVIKLSTGVDTILFAASAGTLTQKGSSLTLKMPAEDVTIAPVNDDLRSGFKDASSLAGYSGEGADKLVDGKTETKWCGAISPSPVTMTFNAKEAVTLVGYQLTTANDTQKHPDRNPTHWTLEGSTNGRVWTMLSEVNDSSVLPGDNFRSIAFSPDSPVTTQYTYYRFTTLQNGGATSFQLSELRLYTKERSDQYEEYDLWLGSTRVTSQNRDDILSDGGKAKFNANTCTLTLDDPEIDGTTPEQYLGNAKILSRLDHLIIQGSYHMTHKETRFGCCCTGSIELKGDFTLYGLDGMYVDKAATFTSGKIHLIGEGLSSHGFSGNDNVTIGKNITELITRSESFNAIICNGSLTIEDGLVISAPVGGVVKEDAYNRGFHTIDVPEGAYAKYVAIEPYKEYDLWVGSTRVTASNKYDILGDGGKAVFNSDTNTLTLSDPVISGKHGDAKIDAQVNLTLKGSYHMTQKESSYGVSSSSAGLTFSGDFTFMGTSSAINTSQYTTVESGSLKAIGGTYGIFSSWEMYIKKAAQRIEMEGSTAAYAGNHIIIEGDQELVLPENGVISDKPGLLRIKESDGSTTAKKAVIELPDKILGDSDGNEMIESIDATYVQRAVVGLETPYKESRLMRGDVDGDGILTVMDATNIQRYLCGLKTNFPIGQVVS